MTETCPVCANTDTHIIWSKPNFEMYQFPFAEGQEISSYRMDQTIHFCGQCHHAYLWPTPKDSTLNTFYESGYSGYTSTLETKGLGSSMNDPACDYIQVEIDRRFGRKVRMAEIGGNDGYVLAQLAHLAEERLLIEPGESAAEIARQHDIPVLEAFFSEEVADGLSGKFDVVICRYVIEHVGDPAAFVDQLATMLAPGGILVLEQPDLPKILDSLLVRVLILIHLNHFSPSSLNRLVTEKCGLTTSRTAFLPSGFIVSLTKEDSAPTAASYGHRRTIDAEPVILANAESFSQRLETQNSKLSKIISGWYAAGKQIWVWGAGTAGGELFNLYGLPFDRFSGYIDSDARKVGMRFAGAPQLPICSPTDAHEKGLDAVLIATFSVGEVLRTIGDLGWEADVAALHNAETYHVGR